MQRWVSRAQAAHSHEGFDWTYNTYDVGSVAARFMQVLSSLPLSCTIVPLTPPAHHVTRAWRIHNSISNANLIDFEADRACEITHGSDLLPPDEELPYPYWLWSREKGTEIQLMESNVRISVNKLNELKYLDMLMKKIVFLGSHKIGVRSIIYLYKMSLVSTSYFLYIVFNKMYIYFFYIFFKEGWTYSLIESFN